MTGPTNGIVASRTTLAVEANAAALQRRLPTGWELAPYAGDDLRGRALRGANLLVPGPPGPASCWPRPRRNPN